MMRKGIHITFFVFFSLSSFSGTLYAKDFIAGLMEDSVATVADAAKLIYYSFHPGNYSQSKKIKKRQAQKKQELQAQMLTPDMLRYLENKGISLTLRNKPIQAKQFAKILAERFQFKVSLSARIFNRDDILFRDIQKLGIFPARMRADKTLTTKEMLSSYLAAKQKADLKE